MIPLLHLGAPFSVIEIQIVRFFFEFLNASLRLHSKVLFVMQLLVVDVVLEVLLLEQLLLRNLALHFVDPKSLVNL